MRRGDRKEENYPDCNAKNNQTSIQDKEPERTMNICVFSKKMHY